MDSHIDSQLIKKKKKSWNNWNDIGRVSQSIQPFQLRHLCMCLCVGVYKYMYVYITLLSLFSLLNVRHPARN